MAITYPLTFPERIPREIVMRSNSTVAVSESPFSGSEQVYVHPREFWEMVMTFPPLRRAQAEELIAFLLSLHGREGTFLAGDPVGRNPRGSVSTEFTVNGASQSGFVLNVKDLPASTTGVLLPGDYLQLGTGADTRLHKVLTQVNTSLSGNAALDIWPRLRTAPEDDSVVAVRNTVGQWRLASNINEWTIQLAQRFSLVIHCKEAL